MLLTRIIVVLVIAVYGYDYSVCSGGRSSSQCVVMTGVVISVW